MTSPPPTTDPPPPPPPPVSRKLLYTLLALALFVCLHALSPPRRARPSDAAPLAVAALAVAGLFRLASRVANSEVAWGTVVCAALHPVFYAESTLAHTDMAAAAATFWGLAVALPPQTATAAGGARAPSRRAAALSLFALAALALVVSERFGAGAGDRSARLTVAASAGRQLWHVVGGAGLWALTAPAALAMLLPARGEQHGEQRRRIDIGVQLVFLAVAAVYVVASLFVCAGAHARHMLPVVPLVILVAVSTLRRRLPLWPLVVAAACAAMIVSGEQ